MLICIDSEEQGNCPQDTAGTSSPASPPGSKLKSLSVRSAVRLVRCVKQMPGLHTPKSRDRRLCRATECGSKRKWRGLSRTQADSIHKNLSLACCRADLAVSADQTALLSSSRFCETYVTACTASEHCTCKQLLVCVSKHGQTLVKPW
jgi:hypothetical protein